MSRVSVLYFTNSIARGGAEEHILTLLRGLDRSVFDLALACPDVLAEKIAGDLPADVCLERLHLRHPRDWRAAARLAYLMRARRVDIVHSHLFYSSLFASPIGWLCRVPVVVETPHLRELWRKGWKASFVVDRVWSRFVDRYIAVSEANARYLLEQKRLPAGKVRVIRNGCDLGRFGPRRAERTSLRRELGIGARQPVLLVAARLEPQKGHAVLLEALPSILAEFHEAHLVCVGDGSLRQQLAEKARAFVDAGTVCFMGYQSRIEDWLAMADIVVLPSYYEGLPLVAIEALAAERPVVATAVDGTTEVVVDGQTGITVPPGDAGALSQAIRALLRRPERAAALAREGRAWVERRFQSEQQVRATESLYLEALGHVRSDVSRSGLSRLALMADEPGGREPGRSESQPN